MALDTDVKPQRFIWHVGVLLWLLILAVPQPAVFAQTSTLLLYRITSEALKGNLIGDEHTRPFLVYFPPSYQTSNRRYPVIYVLHGFGGDAKSLTNRVKSAMDTLIQNGEVQEMIVIFVDGSNRFGGSQYQSSSTIGDYETYIVRELVAFVDRELRTIPHRNSRGITGFSMGGYGSMRLSLKYPEVFSVVVAQAGTYQFDEAWVKRFTDVAGAVLALIDRLGIFSEKQLWQEYDNFSLPIRNGIAYLAAVAPNPEKPPFFLDLPFEVSFFPPRIRRVERVWEAIVENDVIHELERHLQRPERLRAIKLVHGTQDETAFVKQAHTLDLALTQGGIVHEYEEHGGEHTFIAEKSLRFLSKHLANATPAPWDVNNDGLVNIFDLALVGTNFGGPITALSTENPDVNRDGFVNIFDLVLVARHLGESL